MADWERIAITFKNNQIPWLDAAINIKGSNEIPVSLYIDLASSVAIELLVKENQKFELLDSLEKVYLGRGLSGDIYGERGRIASLKIGSYQLKNVLAAFAEANVRSKQPNADGVLSNNALRRFNVIFDYQNKWLYLKPNSFFDEPFD